MSGSSSSGGGGREDTGAEGDFDDDHDNENDDNDNDGGEDTARLDRRLLDRSSEALQRVRSLAQRNRLVCVLLLLF